MTKNFTRPEKAIKSVEELQIGMTVYQLYAVRGDFQIGKTPFIVKSEPYKSKVTDSLFIDFQYAVVTGTGFSPEFIGVNPFIVERSLADMNVIENSYNDNYIFRTKEDAEEAVSAMKLELKASPEIREKIDIEIAKQELQDEWDRMNDYDFDDYQDSRW